MKGKIHAMDNPIDDERKINTTRSKREMRKSNRYINIYIYIWQKRKALSHVNITGKEKTIIYVYTVGKKRIRHT
jgi:hypothetical protein